jgi:hypothetical protein
MSGLALAYPEKSSESKSLGRLPRGAMAPADLPTLVYIAENLERKPRRALGPGDG